MPDKDVVVVALWKAKKYAVTYTIEGVAYTDSVTYGNNLVLDTPVKVGCIFKGWDIDVPLDMPAKDLKLKAKFEYTGVLTTWSEPQKLFVAGLADDVEITIFTLFGKVLYVGKGREFDLPTGVYLVSAGDQLKKVIVQ